jgi:hypothetical protein
MLTPVLSLNDGDDITFWTRTAAGSIWPDRLQVRASVSGASTNVGTLATDVGDFTILLQDINSTYTVGGYPEVWTEYAITISGVGTTPVDGRVAFRYFVEGGGPTGSYSNYIGIDTFNFTDVTVAAPSIAMTKTVGLDPATCATSDNLTVPAGYGGTTVYYCYAMQNTGDVTVTYHTLVDTELGTLLGPDFILDIGPGEGIDTVAAGLTISATITETTVNTATWTITNDTGGQVIAEATDSATVTQGEPTGVSLSSFGAAESTPVWLILLVLGLVIGLGLIIRRRVTA